MVVPRSSTQIDADKEYVLFSVATFKRHSSEFLHKCREKRWVPRDFRYKEGGKEEEAKEVEKLEQEERKLWGEALRIGRTGYSESAMTWVHALALRVFVESILRYGLPPDFVCGLVKVGLHRGCAMLPELTLDCRQPRRWPRRLEELWTPRTRIWEVMRCLVILRDVSRKMILQWHLKCKLWVRRTAIGPHTYFSNSSSLKSSTNCLHLHHSLFGLYPFLNFEIYIVKGVATADAMMHDIGFV